MYYDYGQIKHSDSHSDSSDSISNRFTPRIGGVLWSDGSV